jgi:fructose 1,6-bisphosphatase
MVNLNENLAEVKNYLHLVNDNLDSITEKNFDSTMREINSLTKRIRSKGEFIQKNFPKEQFKNESDTIHNMIKQITNKLDNIVERKKEEQAEISLNLAKLANKKKLINYQR